MSVPIVVFSFLVPIVIIVIVIAVLMLPKKPLLKLC